MIRKALIALLALLGGLGLVLAVGTLGKASRQVTVPPLAPLAVDGAAAAASLSAAVQARTVSGLLDPAGTAAAFDALQAHLQATYPRFHAVAQREIVGGHSLLYTWAGRDAAAPAVVLMAHQDVAPVAPGTEGLWQQPPFSGAVKDGFVWGRGAWDDKGNLIAQFEALERLAAAGFQPRRTVLLVAGHDEEVGGLRGAKPIVELLKQRGVKVDFVIDEGLLIADGMLPGLHPPAALVGVAEKGFVSIKLSVTGIPGHSSMPPAAGQQAIAVLSAALAKVDASPMPGGITGVAEQMFNAVAPEMHGFNRVALSNLWLTGPLVERMLSKGPSTNALMRTTTALTIVSGGNKENVIPGRADAIVNFRLLPGDTPDTVMAHLKQVIADERVQMAVSGEPSLPSKVSSTDSDGYRLIERTLREVFPEAIVAPGLMVGGTDARHFDGYAGQVFRFSPVRAKPADLSRFHGTDERLSIDNLVEMIRFYHRLVDQAAR
ncbi:M20 family peptidase [Rubrivivax albus]|uniref:M20 family peptidase n=1 Tax=Rubrivivax albus TaxID=2499835 RepID=A0A3S2VU75_9BURK|nr:M20 family peptidase [Rubrivivax albus]RVT48900.1 M20 family peptidase [Rubrivivax albus]